MMAINNLVAFTIWLVLFAHTSKLGEWTLQRTMLLFGITATVFGLCFGILGGFTKIPELVRDKGLNTLLLRPQSPMLLVLTSRSEPSAWGDIFSGLMLICLSGEVPASGWLLLPLVIILAGVVALSVSLVFFSLSFWMVGGENVSNRLWDTLITFSVYPESIFPFPVRLVLYTIFPTAIVAFIPVKILTDLSWSSLTVLGIASVIWLLISTWIFNCGVRRFIKKH
jgi:ABC-2 type transport system permease protein